MVKKFQIAHLNCIYVEYTIQKLLTGYILDSKQNKWLRESP